MVIAGTLLKLDAHHPSGLKPSMNRAIQQASFPNDLFDGVSRQTAKTIWEEQGPCIGFLLSGQWMHFQTSEWEPDWLKHAVFVPPDDSSFFLTYQYLKKHGVISSMLSHAKHLQGELSRILAETGAAKVAFIEFPRTIPSVKLDIPDFSPAELKWIMEYSARDD